MNPELQRNLWLEVSLHKLLLIPVVIFAAATLLHSADPNGTSTNKIALTGFIVMTLAWGARQAANSVLDEARARTWDIQRMCALSPWRMTWGKLLGATAMSWYAGLCCLAVFLGSGGSTSPRDGVLVTVLIIAAAVLAHGMAMIGALVGIHRGSGLQSRFANFLVLVLLAFMLPNVTSIIDAHSSVRWYAITMQRLPFGALSAVLFAAWAVLGATRAMSMELKIGTYPVPWLAFSLFVAVFATGFTHLDATPLPALLLTVCVMLCPIAIVQSYIAAFAYPGDPVQTRRAERAFASGRYRHALEELPLWPVSAALALTVGLLITAVGGTAALSDQHFANPGPLGLAAALMMLRDLVLLGYVRMTMRRGLPEATTLIYMGLLDGLLPALLPYLGLASFVPLFWPPFLSAPFTAIAILSAHCAVVMFLALQRYRRLQAGLNETGDG